MIFKCYIGRLKKPFKTIDYDGELICDNCKQGVDRNFFFCEKNNKIFCKDCINNHTFNTKNCKELPHYKIKRVEL